MKCRDRVSKDLLLLLVVSLCPSTYAMHRFSYC
jgi:hypothetical protein